MRRFIEVLFWLDSLISVSIAGIAVSVYAYFGYMFRIPLWQMAPFLVTRRKILKMRARSNTTRVLIDRIRGYSATRHQLAEHLLDELQAELDEFDEILATLENNLDRS